MGYTFALSPKPSGAQSDLETLKARMRQRLYPATMPVLASGWLKTVYAAGHPRRWWKELDQLLERTLDEPFLDAPSRDALISIQSWIERSGIATKTMAVPSPPLAPFRAKSQSAATGAVCPPPVERVVVRGSGRLASR